jgi:serine-type D-Ala-D-Ala carboxypeptidase/endopeptidase (penicillin-binding protein 4)
LLVWVAGWLNLAIQGQETRPLPTVADLQQRLAEHISQPKFTNAFWGVKVVSLASGKTVFEHNAHQLFSPASNSKLFTVALALDRLGPDYRITTSLYAKTRPSRRGTLHGDLIIFGRGDPTLNARLNGGDLFKALEPLVSALTNAGVRRITGDLLGDASYFRGPPYGSGWEWDDLEYPYGARISALTIEDNTAHALIKPGRRAGLPCQITLIPANAFSRLNNRTVTVGQGANHDISFYRPFDQNCLYAFGQMAAEGAPFAEEIPVANPAEWFVYLFREALLRHGIKVRGKVRTLNWPEEESPASAAQRVELGTVGSLPMRDLAREVQKPSQNLYADLLLAHVGERSRTADTPPGETSEELGIQELNKFLAAAGISKEEVFFEEGSGLSRDNLTSPQAIVTLLQFMSRHACAESFCQALPIAGIDGTLKNRMKGTAAAGNARAKTGTLRWANALSGYLTTAAGERLAFSILLNRYHNPTPDQPSRGDLDAIAVLLAGFGGRTDQ